MFRWAKASYANQAKRLVERYVVTASFGFIYAERILDAEFAGGHIYIFLCRMVAEDEAGF